MMMISIQCKRAKYVKGINRQRILLFLINLSFLVKSFMIGVHDLQKSLNVGLLFGNSEVVNAEIVLFSLKLMNFLRFFAMRCFSPSLRLHSISRQQSWWVLPWRQTRQSIEVGHWLGFWWGVFWKPDPSRKGTRYRWKSSRKWGVWFYGI